MSTIVLISIGVLLAAASTLMGVYYGGDAFHAGGVKARAATLENAAQNVLVAVTGRSFSGDHTVPASLDQLHTEGGQGAWMHSLPDVSQSGAGAPVVMQIDDKRIYGVPDVPSDVCAQINRDYHGSGAVIPHGFTGSRRGCMATHDGSHLFYVVLGSS